MGSGFPEWTPIKATQHIAYTTRSIYSTQTEKCNSEKMMMAERHNLRTLVAEMIVGLDNKAFIGRILRFDLRMIVLQSIGILYLIMP